MSRSGAWDEAKRRYLLSLRPGDWNLEGRGSRWASGPAGTLAILAASEARAHRWWLGLNETEFRSRRAVGLVLLCASHAKVLDFGLSASRVEQLLPRLSIDDRGERKLNVVRVGRRFVLQIPGTDGADLTPALGDTSWLTGLREGATLRERAGAAYGHEEQGHPSHIEPIEVPAIAARGGDPVEATFFARIKGGILEPLDPTGLPEGEMVLVRATRVTSVPASGVARRIVAQGGPQSLPSDFAQEHDRYAHGLPSS